MQRDRQGLALELAETRDSPAARSSCGRIPARLAACGKLRTRLRRQTYTVESLDSRRPRKRALYLRQRAKHC